MNWIDSYKTTLNICLKNRLARKYVLIAGLVFAVSIFLVISFTLPENLLQNNNLQLGLFWLVFNFLLILGLNDVFKSEEETGLNDFITASSHDMMAFYLGKISFYTIEFLFLCMILFFIWALLANITVTFSLVLTMFCCAFFFILGSTCLGIQIFLAISDVQTRDVLRPIFFFPLQSALIPAVTHLSYLSNDFQMAQKYWIVLIGASILYLCFGIISCDSFFSSNIEDKRN